MAAGMRVFVLNTGTEILLGDVRDAHLSFIAQQILALGLRVMEQRTVPDGAAIGDALRGIFPRADLIFVTGGLGPTSDDITRDIVAELLGLELVRDEGVFRSIQDRLNLRKIKITPSILRQADVPRGAQVLPNEFGTAPGFFLRAGVSAKHTSPDLFVLPGPPRELQPMFVKHVIPILHSIIPPQAVQRRIYRLAALGESVVESRVGEALLAIPGLEVGYCARPGEVDLRIVGDAEALVRGESIVLDSLGPHIFTSADEPIEEVLIKKLAEKRKTLTVAESCTGGLLANRLTNVSGASEAFLAGYVTYANAAKSDVLHVPEEMIVQHGAVSAEVAKTMAEGALKRAGADYALSTTGIAGPTGGSEDKPVGTVFVGMANVDGKISAHKFFFPTDRETFKQMVAQVAFEMLRKALL